eukprot:scaffold546_cov352-Prasinococcus_capsulatus_cf.AAC.16
MAEVAQRDGAWSSVTPPVLPSDSATPRRDSVALGRLAARRTLPELAWCARAAGRAKATRADGGDDRRSNGGGGQRRRGQRRRGWSATAALALARDKCVSTGGATRYLIDLARAYPRGPFNACAAHGRAPDDQGAWTTLRTIAPCASAATSARPGRHANVRWPRAPGPQPRRPPRARMAFLQRVCSREPRRARMRRSHVTAHAPPGLPEPGGLRRARQPRARLP